MSETSPCPVCGVPVELTERYPNMLCVSCAALARDEQGRPMRFRNETMLGAGFIAEVARGGVWQRVDSGACTVDGMRCVAREHRFGGIVVQAVDADHRVAVVLRAARPQDADAVAAVFGAARRSALSYLPDLHTAEEDRAHFAGVVAAGGTTVAVQGGRVVGFVAVGEASVEHLYVDPAHGRRSIGTALLRHAQAVRPDGLELWVFQRNTVAIAFYERRGFRIAELTDGGGNEEREPDARMVWPGAQRVMHGA